MTETQSSESLAWLVVNRDMVIGRRGAKAFGTEIAGLGRAWEGGGICQLVGDQSISVLSRTETRPTRSPEPLASDMG